jgi:hypothetical protein
MLFRCAIHHFKDLTFNTFKDLTFKNETSPGSATRLDGNLRQHSLWLLTCFELPTRLDGLARSSLLIC